MTDTSHNTPANGRQKLVDEFPELDDRPDDDDPAMVMLALLLAPALAGALPEPLLPEWPGILQTEVVRATQRFDG